MTTPNYDVIVVGCGIQGAGVAQAASAAGNSVLVLEKKSVAAGTSRCSSKLVHGGLRYLETAHIGLVRECLRERELLLHLAPELVQLKKMYLPVYNDGARAGWEIRLGLSLYALLGSLSSNARFSTVPRKDWGSLDGLLLDGLNNVFFYYEAQTDDRLLTQAVVNSARELGAELLMPAELTRAKILEDRVEVAYRMDGKEHMCRSSVLVNAAGPWVNETLERIEPKAAKRAVDLIQGAHLVLRGETSSGIYYVEHPQDSRMLFVMPWQGNTLLGTTETEFQGDLENVCASDSEMNYLLNAYRHYFPKRSADLKECISSFAGLRVLPQSSSSVFKRSRETFLLLDNENQPRLVSIYGGKLTAYRALGERVLRSISSSLPSRRVRADTRSLKLSRVES